jgi:MFS family permease
VPLGAIGITLFSIDIYFASQHFPQASALIGASDLLKIPSSWRILLDLSLIGLFGGIYIVPLNAMIQHRSHPQHRARVIAANNILNALLMVGSAIGTILLLQLGFSIPTIFLWLGLCNIVMTLSLFLLLPEFIEHFIKWLHLIK